MSNYLMTQLDPIQLNDIKLSFIYARVNSNTT